MSPVRVNDKVELLVQLAVGGMGTIWLARHRELEAEVVVKLVAQERLRDDPAAAARFALEARAASRLASPHTVRVYDTGVSPEGVPYLVMERLRGESLAARLSRGPLSLADAITVVGQVAAALSEAHALGIVHRDVKPANVFLVDHALGLFAKVLDFGVAKLLDGDDGAARTEAGALMGTPAYMSPEQLLDASDIDHRSDLWSLAVLAYEALTGQRPFRGSSVAALSLAICDGRFTPATERREDLPRALDTWFARALSVSTEDRFSDALEQARALAGCAGQESVAATPPPGRSTSGEAEPLSTTIDTRPRRHRAWAWLAVPSAAVALLALVAFADRTPASLAAAHVELVQRLAPARARSSPARTSAAPPRSASPSPSIAAPPPRAKSSAPATRPAFCGTDDAFVIDARGIWSPRPECL
jgi:serine/threonine protein kinase